MVSRWSLLLILWSRESSVTTTFLFSYNLILCTSSLDISDSILSLRGLLFVLLLSWLWFWRGIVKVFFTDNCFIKKLIISSLFEIFFSNWEILFLNKSDRKQWKSPRGSSNTFISSIYLFRLPWGQINFIRSIFYRLKWNSIWQPKLCELAFYYGLKLFCLLYFGTNPV